MQSNKRNAFPLFIYFPAGNFSPLSLLEEWNWHGGEGRNNLIRGTEESRTEDKYAQSNFQYFLRGSKTFFSFLFSSASLPDRILMGCQEIKLKIENETRERKRPTKILTLEQQCQKGAQLVTSHITYGLYSIGFAFCKLKSVFFHNFIHAMLNRLYF